MGYILAFGGKEMAEEEVKQSFVQKILIVCAIALLIVIIIVGFGYVVDVIMLAFAAILLAVFLRGLSEILRKYVNIGESTAVLIVCAVLMAMLAASISSLAPSVADQARNLRTELPRSAENVADYISSFGWGKTVIAQMPSISELEDKLNPEAVIASVGGFFSSTAGMIANFFITILLAIYLAVEPKTYISGLTKLFPVSKRARASAVVYEIGETLRWWLIGKIGSMFVIGVLTWIGLSIIGVPLALTLGLIAGLLSFVPNFGPILSAIPAILLAFIQSPITAVYVAVLYIGVQLIESNLITPWIERQTVELPPALTIFSQLVLAVLIGGLGLVLATPILAVIMVVVQMLYIQDVLGDDDLVAVPEDPSGSKDTDSAEIEQENL
ncbi:MAG: AI-2E family transporter [Pyrinomonadaceae bacterium]|nr:AI-2E family transporter [Pyrinomonadaceae bacterium]